MLIVNGLRCYSRGFMSSVAFAKCYFELYIGAAAMFCFLVFLFRPLYDDDSNINLYLNVCWCPDIYNYFNCHLFEWMFSTLCLLAFRLKGDWKANAIWNKNIRVKVWNDCSFKTGTAFDGGILIRFFAKL